MGPTAACSILGPRSRWLWLRWHFSSRKSRGTAIKRKMTDPGMRHIADVFHKPNLRRDGKTVTRQAVRGIILADHGKSLALMVHSTENGDYKFPGGGIEPGEDQAAALTREVREECGAQITGEIIPYGQ